MLSVYFVTAYEGDDCDENVAPVYSSSMQGGMAEDNWDINNGMVNQQYSVAKSTSFSFGMVVGLSNLNIIE